MSARTRAREAVRCHFDGKNRWCSGEAVVQRGAVPLCEPCEGASSSLKRLAMTPLGTGMYVDGQPSRQAPVQLHERLFAVSKAATAVRVANERQKEAVRLAYQAGGSWVMIGKALGVTRQAAQARYGESAS